MPAHQKPVQPIPLAEVGQFPDDRGGGASATAAILRSLSSFMRQSV